MNLIAIAEGAVYELRNATRYAGGWAGEYRVLRFNTGAGGRGGWIGASTFPDHLYTFVNLP